MTATLGEAEAAGRLDVLIRMSAVVDGARALEDVVPALFALLVPAVADLCAVEDVAGRVVAIRYAGPDAEDIERRMLRRAPSRPEARAAGTRVLEDVRPVLVAEIDDALRAAIAHDDEELELFRRMALQSLVVSPLRAHGSPLGTLVLATRADRPPYREEDLQFAAAVARELARALADARVAALTRELEALVDNMDDAVNVRDMRGRIVLANAASAAMLGAGAPEELPDTPLTALWERFALFDADGRELHDDDLPWYRLLHGADHVEPLLMRRVVRATGEQQWLLNKSTAIRDEGGRVVLVMSVTEDVTAARRAEIGQHLLVEAGRLLSRSLDVEGCLSEVAELVVPTLADCCGIDLPGNAGVLEEVALAHAEPGQVAAARELRRRRPIPVAGAGGIAEVLRTGTPLRADDVAEATDDAELEHLRAVGVRSVLAVPVRAGDKLLGVLVLGVTQPDRRLDEQDLELADALGRRIGEALRNARLYRERDEVAHVLSAGLAPEQAPEVAGCEVALRYRPAGEGVETGGDFYEVVDTPSGSIVVIGDVAGKGAAAAALSAVSRVTLRTAGRLTGDPRAALEELNHGLRRRASLSLCTVAAVALPQELPGEARVLLAGHPPPLLRRDGGVREVGRPGPLLGAVEAADWPVESVELEPGDTLVLYTDGVLDAVLPGGERFGEDRLAALVTRAGDDPEALVEALDATLADLRLRDDVAMLAIRCPGVVPLLARDGLDVEHERLLRLALAGGRQAPAHARDAVRTALDGRVEDSLLSDVLLIASELVTNAVRHGGASTPGHEVEVHMALVGDGVRLEVVDPGEGFEPGGHGPRHDGGYGLHLLDRLACRWGVAGSTPTTVWSEFR